MENFRVVQCATLRITFQSKNTAQIRGYSLYPPSSRAAAWPRCRAHPVIAANQRTGNILTDGVRRLARRLRGHKPEPCAAGFDQNALGKEKTRPGGQPDGSSHMGAWGGWALAPNTADGEGLTAPTLISRSSRAGRSKHPAIFLTFYREVPARRSRICREKSRQNPRGVRGKAAKNHRAAGRLASFAADLSDAIDGAESFSALLTEALLRSGVFSAAG